MGSLPDPAQRERFQAFLECQPAARPLLACTVGFTMPEQYPATARCLPQGLVSPEAIRTEAFLADCSRLYQLHGRLADDFPFVAAPFVYVPWLEAIMGCPIHASETSMWAQPVVDAWDQWRWEQPAPDNPWWRKLLELTAALVQHSAGRYPVAPTLMRGPSDMLSALRGAARFPLDFYDCPDLVASAARLCADVWIAVGKSQLDLIPQSATGYMAGAHGLRVWAPDKIIWLQEDAMALLSPVIFRNYILPQDRRIAAHFPYTAFHLHGSALWAIRDLVSVPEIRIVELNHESARADIEGTFAGCHQIRQHKPTVIWKQFDNTSWSWLDRVLAEFPAGGLSLQLTIEDVATSQAIMTRLTRQGSRAAPHDPAGEVEGEAGHVQGGPHRQ